MEQAYKPVENGFREYLQEVVTNRPFIRVQYITDIREFATTTAVPTELIETDGAAYLLLATGEEIRLDRLVRIGDTPAPGYSADYFKCDL
ncbi:hypothetical protein MKJ04_13620 [Pontibacter sp. E15-1]|uniref:hypothetical protein n=1 Tax=Pontibacter sp. E15-1 TaxID=2919918 RepID=UPI001F4F8171|nr:hypothetical protein [Pontibacter sp. E15-1]MCJ8165885.1 hypothetical protein [Pontibacter sp. E15-1]